MKLHSFFRLAAAYLFLCTVPLQASFAAGFHYQLDLTAKLVNSPQGELTAIQMSWVYDKELSTILMDGEDLSEAKKEETLKKRSADILKGLSEVKFFTKVLLGETALPFLDVEIYTLRLNKESRLQMNLTLPLKNKQQLKDHILKIILTDDSAVGLVTFVDTSHMLLSDQFKAMCKKPTLLQKKLAEIDGHAQIAETMTIDCTA